MVLEVVAVVAAVVVVVVVVLVVLGQRTHWAVTQPGDDGSTTISNTLNFLSDITWSNLVSSFSSVHSVQFQFAHKVPRFLTIFS
jgi:hypothetical protein